MALRRIQIGKLIRDRVPEILQEKGVMVHQKILDHDAYVAKLKDKLLEEADEARYASGLEELREELADLVEVIHCLSRAAGVSLEQIEEMRLQKNKAKGSFEKKIYTPFFEIEEKDQNSINPSCLFCQIVHQEKEVPIFAEYRHCFAIKDAYPVSEGHLLIIPYDHIDNWFEAKEDIRLDMIRALHQLKGQLDNDLSPDGYNIGANCGDAAGQSIMHLHMHLIPRYKGDMENPKGGVRGVIPSKQNY